MPFLSIDTVLVRNRAPAFRWVQEQLREAKGLPICVPLLCDAHRLLLAGDRGAGKQPGGLRRSQNWVGGTRPGGYWGAWVSFFLECMAPAARASASTCSQSSGGWPLSSILLKIR